MKSISVAVVILFSLAFSIDAFLPSTRRVTSTTHHPQHPSLIGIVQRQTKLHGIKGFRAWFESAFPSAVVTINPSRYPPNRRGSSPYNKDDRNNRNNYSGDTNGNCEPELFDHVLIDANQFLHTSLRKAYNRRAYRYNDSISIQEQQQLDDEIVEHALMLFLREINRITSTTAVPRKSLVVALDGAPGAAKLDMQRRRRYTIYNKAENQERQIQALKDRGWRENDFDFFGGSKGKKRLSLYAKHERERVTLNITPGTAFMDRVTDALLYWAWQHVTRFPRVRMYLSPSCVHGEGEVKLLDWVTHGHELISMPRSRHTNIQQNETVAILGGDSDLVLMGLVVPPSITHNIHVILPQDKGKSLVVSVWETSRMMARMIEGTATYGLKASRKAKKVQRKRKLKLKQINQARIDTALLIIMGGNDYLPKLRGSRGGFDTFFKVYLNLVKKWMDESDSDDDAGDSFLINFDANNELYLNVPFAIAFFRELASISDTFPRYKEKSEDGSPSTQSDMGVLNNLCEAKILPFPMSFNTITTKDSAFDRELWVMNSKMSHSTIFPEGTEIVRLTLGNFPEDCMPFSDTSSTSGSKEICNTVLGESDGHGVISRMIRSENSTTAGRAYLFEVPHRQKGAMKATKDRLSSLALEHIFGRDSLESLFGGSENDEKPRGLAQADAAAYLGGLLWNLETYQFGCCVDYGYDYGGRYSPAPYELIRLLERIQLQGQLKLKSIDLIGKCTTKPISDGLSCLAAVPPQAWHIVPEPYSWLVEPSRSERFDKLYNSCFDEKTNAFDLASFEKRCNRAISKIRKERKAEKSNEVKKKEEEVVAGAPGQGRRIYAGNKFWTVLSLSGIPLAHQFQPPSPFTNNVRSLKNNRRIRVTKFPVKTIVDRGGSKVNATSIDDQDDDETNLLTIHEIPFKKAFNSRK